ncbi:transferrin-like [Condylostylus longicornis]|uniref:transferrin-like n=1 Tax=Condylostylus longicornis TaxID=2530218 RepID=UPI00244DC537|nr:transferrin-like [Condylostylus longicornis]
MECEEDVKVLKICVPHSLLENCKDLLPYRTKDGPQIGCISARDRIECLELLQNNEAHVVVVYPEDVLFAAGLSNDAFKIIAEFRNEKNDTFEEEDQVLIKASSKIKSFEDLKGLKSCLPKFNSYYGYKVNPSIPRSERELKALSDFFNQSCLVGPYSDDENINEEWKKKYSNLCQLCENPVKCDEYDKYANYDGAIECLINGDGDVAFTTRSDIRKYFGLLGDEENENVKNANINDYELLCEDGSRRPINGTGCSLLKKPNTASITTTKITDDPMLLNGLLSHLETFFKNGLNHSSADLLIEEGMELHIKPTPVSAQDYTKEFKKYFERDESYTYKVKLCVSTHIDLEKCQVMAKIAFLYDIRPEIQCFLSEKNECAAEVANDEAHIAIIPGYDWEIFENKYKNLKRLAYESWNFHESYIALFNGFKRYKSSKKYPIKFEMSDKKAFRAACLFHLLQEYEDQTQNCENLNGNVTETEDYILVVNATERHFYGREQHLLCLDKSTSNIGDFYYCNLDLYIQNAIYVNGNKSDAEIETFKNLITTIGEQFGNEGIYSNGFHIFAEFKGKNDVLFNDYTMNFSEGLANFETMEVFFRDLMMKVLKYD